MKLAIADPPYLGRANRWYGTGRGSQGGKHKADSHPEAKLWDDPTSHQTLLERLSSEYDGWAIALNHGSLQTYLAWCPEDVQVMVWHRRNSVPSGARIRNTWEPVIIRVPPASRARIAGLTAIADVLDVASPRIGFTGSKPPEWTRWVLACLGYDPTSDSVDDIFPGSNSVSLAAQGMLL